MIKKHVTEIIEEFDTQGKLVKKTTTETHEEDTNRYGTTQEWWYNNTPSLTNTPYVTSPTATLANCADAAISQHDRTETTITA